MAALFCVGLSPMVARADVFRDIAFGLGFVGFDFQGSQNVLSGGTDFLATNTFVGNPLDFGAWDLTLQGPVSLALSTGGRTLSTLDFAVRTAPDAAAGASPLSYILNYDVGGQSAQITGSILLDANFSLNGFGFYDLEFTYSSRQDVERSGGVANDSNTFDMDLGPINVSGNIFTDVLAVLTEPLFDRAGRTNPFAQFSGQAQLQRAIETRTSEARQRLAAGGTLTEEDIPALTNAAILDALASGDGLALGRFDIPIGSLPARIDGVVPEPTVLLFMLLGLPVVFRRRLRIHSIR